MLQKIIVGWFTYYKKKSTSTPTFAVNKILKTEENRSNQCVLWDWVNAVAWNPVTEPLREMHLKEVFPACQKLGKQTSNKRRRIIGNWNMKTESTSNHLPGEWFTVAASKLKSHQSSSLANHSLMQHQNGNSTKAAPWRMIHYCSKTEIPSLKKKKSDHFLSNHSQLEHEDRCLIRPPPYESFMTGTYIYSH